jgi:photosystem II stability/assembly factor-like uncharacterized protein
VSLPAGIADLQAISCPDAAVCYAAGGSEVKHRPAVVVTRNHGRTWTVLKLPKPTAGADRLNVIACPSTHECFTAGVGPILRTKNGGSSWTKQAALTSRQYLSGIACPTTTVCTVVGSTSKSSVLTPLLLDTTDRGAKWKAEHLSKGPNLVHDVSGPSAARCWLVAATINPSFKTTHAYVLDTGNGGSKWQTQASYDVKPTANGFLDAIACATRTHCAAVGRGEAVSSSYAIYTTDGG